jgi:hypothetical protein
LNLALDNAKRLFLDDFFVLSLVAPGGALQASVRFAQLRACHRMNHDIKADETIGKTPSIISQPKAVQITRKQISAPTANPTP